VKKQPSDIMFLLVILIDSGAFERVYNPMYLHSLLFL